MTQYAKTTPGAPTVGRYAFGDTILDSLNIVHTCIQGGFPGTFVASPPILVAGATTAPKGVVVAAGVVATEYGSGTVRTTRLTLTEVVQAVVNGTEYQGTELYNFPQGRIAIIGVTGTLAQKTTSAILSTINGSSTGAFSLGTVIASATTLASTMANLLPSAAFTSSATINVAGTAVNTALVATPTAQFDGTATAIKAWLNSAFATTGDVDADGTQTFTGTIDLTWAFLGDY